MQLRLTCILFLFCSVLTAQNDHIRKQVDKIIQYDTDISFEETPGFIIAIIDNDTSFVLEYGREALGSELPLFSHSLFELGSITKVFTASLIAELVHQEKLDYDFTFNDLFPEGQRNEALAHLSITDFLMHNTGLPKLPESFGQYQKDPRNHYANYSKDQLRSYYQEFQFKKRKKKKNEFEYSHLNYALLEIGLESYFNESFESLMKTFLLDKYDLSNTCITACKTKPTMGYDRSTKPTKPWFFQSFAASEGLKSNMDDLIKFVQLNLGLKNQLSPFNDLHQPKLKSPMSKHLHIGRAWHILKGKKHYNIISHSGRTNGHSSFIAMMKETKTGVIVLSNSGIGTNDLALLILRMINNNWKRKN